jgi:hypothetical protein
MPSQYNDTSNVYMTNVADARAMIADQEKVFRGEALISLECQENGDDGGIASFIAAAPNRFMFFVSRLAVREQDFLLAYYLLNREQNSLSDTHLTTQTCASSVIRAALKVMCAFIIFGGADPSVTQLRAILEPEGLEVPDLTGFTKPEGRVHSTSSLFREYCVSGSFAAVGRKNKIHRPELRRLFRRVAETLERSARPASLALAAYIRMKIEQKSVLGVGDNQALRSKQRNVRRVDSPILGDFVLDIEHPDIETIFVPKRMI